MESTNRKSSAFDIFNYLLLSVVVFVCIYPFYYIFIYSISDPEKVVFGISIIPAGINLDTYIHIFSQNNILSALSVSFFRSLIGTVITVLGCSMFAYLLIQEKMFFRKVVYRMLVITMYINAGLIPWYISMKLLHLNNNFLLYVLPSAVSAFNVILIKTYMEQLPAPLEESAKIDGAGYMRIFFSIILPLSKPILATIAVFSAVSQWNSWMDNYFLVPSQNLKTIQLVLYEYMTSASAFSIMSASEITQKANENIIKITPESVKTCVSMIVTIPILLVYPFLQRYFVKGIMLGAVKG